MPVPARTPCPVGISKDSMQAISAPYDFVPLNDWVHVPDWGEYVSHDHPFRDGLCGEIYYTLVAESPILVGGRQDKKDGDRPHTEVHPYRLPDGTYAIPGSSLKGMLRAVVEIIGFGRLRMVDDIRPGLRDISGKHVAKSYTDKVRDKVKTGFLRARGGGRLEIVPCRMARLPHKAIERAFNEPQAFRWEKNVKDKSVHEKYERWRELCARKGWDPEHLRFDLDDKGNAIHLGQGAHKGFPVFTGQISDSRQKNGKGKKRDFVFYDKWENEAIPVPPDAWRDFLHIHGDDTDEEGMSWPGYWRAKFHAGEAVPVFYLQDRGVLRIGLAYMPKLAGDFSTLDCIAHVSEAHRENPGVGRYDLADLIFGAINGENQDDAQRGRVNVEAALAEGDPEPETQEDTILNGPKPTYFPNYLEQPTDASGLRLKGGDDAQYATYIAHGQNQKPRLRGRKRYPARPDDKVAVQGLLPSQRGNHKVQIRLHTLPAGTTFRGRLVFHNLKPEELGALLWAMTWGGDDGLRHGLGMGKPFGFGQVRLRLDPQASYLLPNDPEKPARALDEAEVHTLMAAFEAHMEAAAKHHGRTWKDSPPMRNLLAMADPESADNLPRGMALRHMCLDPKNRRNEFVWAKQRGLVLADYAEASEWPTEATQARWRSEQARLRSKTVSSTAREVEGGGWHPWLKEQLKHVLDSSKANDMDELMRHKKLFQAWKELDDPELKKTIFEIIQNYWEEKGWWDEPPSKTARQLKEKYQRQAKKL